MFLSIHYVDTSRYYSCSLPCSKAHKSVCKGAKPAKNDAVQNHIASTEDSSSKQPIKEDLDQLFQQYPQLRGKLDAIYQQTLELNARSGGRHQSRNPHFETHWNEEKGFEQGLRTLKAKLASDSTDQEDLRAFAAFVSSRSDDA